MPRLLSEPHAGTPGGRTHLTGLDALRAVAALSVLLYHARILLTGPHPFGTLADGPAAYMCTGVFLFFALSGYLIGGPFIRALLRGEAIGSMRAYARRRVARILPAYYVAMGVSILVIPVPPVTVGSVVIHGALLQSLFPGESRALFPVAWTLGIEACFYVLVPLAALALSRRRRQWTPRALTLGIAAMTAASLAFWGIGAVIAPDQLATAGATGWPDSPLATLAFFGPGLLVAVARETSPRWWPYMARKPIFPLAIAIAIWSLAGLVNQTWDPTGLELTVEHLLVIAASGLALVAAINARGTVLRVAGILAPVGTISYSVYVWQLSVVYFLQSRGIGVQPDRTDLSWLRAIVILTAVTLPLAALTYFAAERPGMRWAARRERKQRVLSDRGRHGAVAEVGPEVALTPSSV